MQTAIIRKLDTIDLKKLLVELKMNFFLNGTFYKD